MENPEVLIRKLSKDDNYTITEYDLNNKDKLNVDYESDVDDELNVGNESGVDDEDSGSVIINNQKEVLDFEYLENNNNLSQSNIKSEKNQQISYSNL